MGYNLVITTFIVVTVIIRGVLRYCLLLVASCSNEVHCLVVKYFLLLVRGKVLGLTTLQDSYKQMVRKVVKSSGDDRAHQGGTEEGRAEVARGTGGARPTPLGLHRGLVSWLVAV